MRDFLAYAKRNPVRCLICKTIDEAPTFLAVRKLPEGAVVKPICTVCAAGKSLDDMRDVVIAAYQRLTPDDEDEVERLKMPDGSLLSRQDAYEAANGEVTDLVKSLAGAVHPADLVISLARTMSTLLTVTNRRDQNEAASSMAYVRVLLDRHMADVSTDAERLEHWLAHWRTHPPSLTDDPLPGEKTN